MNDDPVIQAVREARHRISESVGHDPHRLVAYYRQRQERRQNCPAHLQPSGTGICTDLKQELLLPAHESWHSLLLDALGNMDGDFLHRLNTNRNWLPGVEKCFAAFAVPRNRVRVVWLGESPYPRQESAAGISFYDAAIGPVFRPDGKLTTQINKTTSLRNILKAWFIAIDRLQIDRTKSCHIGCMNKEGLITNLRELFCRGERAGWLWLNAGLSLRTDGTASKRAQIEAWRPLIRCVLQDVSRRGATTVLLGKFSERFQCLVNDPQIAPHPCMEPFVRCENMHAFLRNWRYLIEDQQPRRNSAVLGRC